MIKLSVQPYCHNCIQFSPEVLRDRLYGDSREVITEQYVICEHRLECGAIAEHIINELSKSSENKGE